MKRAALTLAILLTVYAPSSLSAALPTVRILPASLAVDIATAALKACSDKGYSVGVTIVDPAGAMRVVIAGDGVKSLDIDASRRKAYTAAILRSATSDIAASVAAAPEYGKVLAGLDPAFLLLGGGVPILAAEGDFLGAVGVGGAPGGEKDEACAKAGIQSVADRLK